MKKSNENTWILWAFGALLVIAAVGAYVILHSEDHLVPAPIVVLPPASSLATTATSTAKPVGMKVELPQPVELSEEEKNARKYGLTLTGVRETTIVVDDPTTKEATLQTRP